MTDPEPSLDQDPVFARFLGAAVGEDDKGTNVTVLSMLARLDVDPWKEAEDLTRMPETSARQRLEALLERFKDVPTLVSERGRLALGLLSFLPRQTKSAGPSPDATATATTQSGLAFYGVSIYWIIGMVLLVGYIASLASGN